MRKLPFLRRVAGWWLVILVFAIANGALREAVLAPVLGRVAGNLLSGLLLSIVIVVAAAAAVRRPPPLLPREAVLLGLFWFALTIVFEFSLGLAQGKTLTDLLAPYRFEGGNLWPVVLLVALVAPWLWSARERRRRRK